ncbi:TIGR03943 family putative permease subunit [Streptomyces sp. A012304]|uniref:TIGR03943 family putative permease subunit n=1 Tax=Streptomyces sp. A012304 TaxID=375446 RepID=UPI00223138CF|nr:TIGR03943 family protein [Streptomyces sp. A012304]GKQ34415.1 membrane protein [Streptomyces sp. A012304]
MNRQAQAAVLFLLGAALLHAGATDLYLRYVKSGLQPLVLAAGAVLIVTAAATAWYERGTTSSSGREERGAAGPSGRHEHGADARAERDEPDALAPAGGDEPGVSAPAGHSHREPRVAWLLLLPLLALILVAPPALGSYSATRTGTALQEPPAFAALPPAGPLRLSVADYAGRAVYDQGRGLAGRRIELTGFLAVDREGTPYLVRMALSCCAADAQPVKVGLTGRVPPVLQPDTWLRITGTYTARRAGDPVNGGPIPFIEVGTATPVEAPRDPYDETWNS